jgi:hypothetical protein
MRDQLQPSAYERAATGVLAAVSDDMRDQVQRNATELRSRRHRRR